jgi:hypothetical protein
MHGDPKSSDPRSLGQARLSVQVRGDYRDIKSFAIALLDKFPGLALERLSVRRSSTPGAAPAAFPSSAPAEAMDEATVEFIQYTRPAKLPPA